MTDATQDRYRKRLQRVLDHVDQHLDDKLDLDTLSSVAAFSKHHFHRQFSATFGVSVHRYVQLARMKRAAFQLSSVPGSSITAIALDAGYDAPDAFARAFRERFGQAPSAFRVAPNWDPLERALEPLHQARSKLMPFSPNDVTIRRVPDMAVACMTHHGDPGTIHTTVKRFIAWRQVNGLAGRELPLFGVFSTDTRVTAPDEFRMDICIGSAAPIAPNPVGVHASLIPGGRCAVLRVLGAAGDDLEPAALFLYRDWLPASGEELREFPIYCERVKFYPLVPTDEAITDLYLPLA